MTRPTARERFPFLRKCDPALVVFAALAVVAAVVYFVLGRHLWFFLDDWDFLAARNAHSVNNLLQPHNQHWTTLPILVWRALWAVVGLHSYLPYEALSIALHIVVAALCRAVMRRASVRPWLATAGAAVLLFFGAGSQNVFFAFQITFTGALAFGFAQLLLADHDGPLDRRDALGLLAGAGALMCSGVGVAMVAVVGLAAFMRRGWHAAAFHTAPLAALYGLWYVRYGRSQTQFTGSVGGMVRFARSGIDATFDALGHVWGVGWVIAASIVVGLGFIAWRGSARRDRLAVPGALLFGTLVFFLAAAAGRNSTSTVIVLPNGSRFLYTAAALLLPVIAVAIEELTRRSRVLGLAGLALLLVGVPGNCADAARLAHAQTRLVAPSREVLLSIAHVAGSDRAPASLHPDPVGAPWVTMGWLRAESDAGRVPKLDHPSPSLLASDRLRLALMEIDLPPTPKCPRLQAPVTVHLALGERADIGDGVVTVTDPMLPDARATFGNLIFRSNHQQHALVAVSGPLSLRFAPTRGYRSQLCAVSSSSP